MNCMEENKEELPVCPHCGFCEAENPALPHQLPYHTVLNGKYMVGKAIGEGGFGITYIGWDLNLGIKVAIKEFYPEGFVGRYGDDSYTVRSFQGDSTVFFQKGKDKFLEEARSLGKFMNLPGIVSVKDFFLQNNTVYIVMEYLEGQSLKAYAKEHEGKVERDELLEIMKPVIESLVEVHKSGLIHRDISPDNIMICKDGNVKLIDFGAARETSPKGEKTLSVMLKKGYSPEEQYRTHGEQGTWTDVYAMCATIYAMLTGVKPDEPLDRMENETLKAPSEYGVKLTKRQENVLLKGLEIKASDRVQTMEELFRGLYCEGKENEFALKKHKNKKRMAVGIAAAIAVIGMMIAFVLNNNLPIKDRVDISMSAMVNQQLTTDTVAGYLPEGASNILFFFGNQGSDNLTISAMPESGDVYELTVQYDVEGKTHERDMELKVLQPNIEPITDVFVVETGKSLNDVAQAMNLEDVSKLFVIENADYLEFHLIDNTDNSKAGKQTANVYLTYDEKIVFEKEITIEYIDADALEQVILNQLKTYKSSLTMHQDLNTYADYFHEAKADSNLDAIEHMETCIKRVSSRYAQAKYASTIAGAFYPEAGMALEEATKAEIQNLLQNPSYTAYFEGKTNIGISVDIHKYSDKGIPKIDIVYYTN